MARTQKQKENWKRWYENNKASHLARVRKWELQRRKDVASWLLELKSRLKCERCGFSHPAAMDFHHVSGKEFSIGDSIRLGYSKTKIEEEIKKCEVLCANCHRIEHFMET